MLSEILAYIFVIAGVFYKIFAKKPRIHVKTNTPQLELWEPRNKIVDESHFD